MANIKYSDSTPVDEPVRRGKVKAIEPGSGIKARPLSDMERAEEMVKLKEMRAAKFSPEAMEARYGSKEETQMPRTDEMGSAYKKGGMTASKRADGIAQRGKTRGTMVMCGGGMSK